MSIPLDLLRPGLRVLINGRPGILRDWAEEEESDGTHRFEFRVRLDSDLQGLAVTSDPRELELEG